MQTWFVMVRALPSWLSLTRPQRRALAEQHLYAPLRACPDLRMRYFDAEAHSAVCSDIMVFQAAANATWTDFFEGLRDSPLFAQPLFELVHIVPAIENGYIDYEARHPVGTAPS